MRMFSEREYDLPELWFTGKQWSDGTAERVYRQLYRERRKELIKNLPAPIKRDYFDKWFAHSLFEDESKL